MPQTTSRPARGSRAAAPAATDRRQEQAQSSERNRPVHEVRLGAIKAAVWANEGNQGVFYNVTFSRVYRDRERGWQSASTFGRDDLLVLAKVADLAHTWICEESQAQAQDNGEGTG